jgi:hypothetical protein
MDWSETHLHRFFLLGALAGKKIPFFSFKKVRIFKNVHVYC